jgi:hypothetical protein
VGLPDADQTALSLQETARAGSKLACTPFSERRITELNARVREHTQISTQARNEGQLPDCK